MIFLMALIVYFLLCVLFAAMMHSDCQKRTDDDTNRLLRL